MNDIRLDTMEKTTLLNICEQDESSKVAQKGTLPVEIGEGKYIIMSCNYLEPCGQGKHQWARDDIDALRGRCFNGENGGLQWSMPLPDEVKQSVPQNARKAKCRSCSAKFVRWCISSARAAGSAPDCDYDVMGGTEDDCEKDTEVPKGLPPSPAAPQEDPYWVGN